MKAYTIAIDIHPESTIRSSEVSMYNCLINLEMAVIEIKSKYQNKKCYAANDGL